MRAVGLNHGDHKTRQIRRVRVRRDRRPSVICVMAADSLPSSWRSGKVTGRIGLGIAPAGGERAGHFTIYQPNTRRTGVVEIVNRRGSQADAYANRMAAVNSGDKAEFRAAEPGAWCVALHAARMRGSPQFVGGSTRRRISTLRLPRGGKNRHFQFRPRHGAEGINKTERSSHEIHDVYD